MGQASFAPGSLPPSVTDAPFLILLIMKLILISICSLISIRKRTRPGRAVQRWNRYREKAAEPFGPSHQEEGSTDYEADSIQPTKPADDAEPVEDAETAENA